MLRNGKTMSVQWMKTAYQRYYGNVQLKVKDKVVPVLN
jgi:hypothetical protein